MAEPTPVSFGVAGIAGPRPRTCARCEKLADLSERKGWPRPPVFQPRSWLVGRVRYYGALCHRCEDVESQERAKLRDQRLLGGGDRR